MGIVSVWLAITNTDGSFPNPVLSACFFGVIWGGFTLLGVYLWVFSWKYKLEFDKKAIRQTGPFTQNSMPVSKIKNAFWRNWPQGGSIKLESDECRMSIELGNIETEFRAHLLEFLRTTIPVEKQANWDKFLLRPAKSKARKSLPPFWLAIPFYAFAVIFFWTWVWGFGAQDLAVAFMNCALATFLLLRN